MKLMNYSQALLNFEHFSIFRCFMYNMLACRQRGPASKTEMMPFCSFLGTLGSFVRGTRCVMECVRFSEFAPIAFVCSLKSCDLFLTLPASITTFDVIKVIHSRFFFCFFSSILKYVFGEFEFPL